MIQCEEGKKGHSGGKANLGRGEQIIDLVAMALKKGCCLFSHVIFSVSLFLSAYFCQLISDFCMYILNRVTWTSMADINKMFSNSKSE